MSCWLERLRRYILITTLLFIYIVPLTTYLKKFQIVSFQKICFFVSSFFSIFYLCLCLCYRGFVNKQFRLNNFGMYVPSSCTICMQIKPERAHHCSKCRKCIMKMDHHCHWIGRCINYYNICHFIRFILFTFISISFMTIFNLQFLYYNAYLQQNVFKFNDGALCCTITIMSIFVFIVTFAHLITQIYNACRNITYIELMKRKSIGISKSKIYNSVYNLGLFENLKETFGSPYLLFLWMPQGDGINYRKNKNFNINNDIFYEEDDMFFEDI